MSFKIAQVPADDQLAQVVSVELLTQLYPQVLICQVLTEQRERKLSQVLVVS